MKKITLLFLLAGLTIIGCQDDDSSNQMIVPPAQEYGVKIKQLCPSPGLGTEYCIDAETNERLKAIMINTSGPCVIVNFTDINGVQRQGFITSVGSRTSTGPCPE